jgi:hypothetical protein
MISPAEAAAGSDPALATALVFWDQPTGKTVALLAVGLCRVGCW